jgi:hypothetical protein
MDELGLPVTVQRMVVLAKYPRLSDELSAIKIIGLVV